jgi:hypothetical protein
VKCQVNEETHTRIIPASWSTYDFSVSIKSIRGLDFFGFPSDEVGDDDEGSDKETGSTGLMGVKGGLKPG